MKLIETRCINDVLVNGYYESKEAWFTREQIGSALEYNNPQNAITLSIDKVYAYIKAK